MRITKSLAILAALASGIASQAHAGTTFTYDSYTVLDNAAGATGTTAVITDTALGVNVNAYVGMIALHGSGANLGGVLDVYCVDIIDDLQASGTYNITYPTGLPNPQNLSAPQIAAISALIANGDNFTAVQFAIWETEYGSDVSFSGADADQAVAATYLANVANGTWAPPTGYESLYNLSNIPNQNLVGVPEPSALALFGVALLGLGYMARRKGVI
jgi:hypothetical protein